MTSQDFIKMYGKQLSQYEREEAADFDMIYYASFNMKNKGIGQYVKGELTCQDENPKQDDQSGGIYNHGFDNDQADYLFEAKDQIMYRYEVQKKLGRGAFGVVIRCFDHKNKEQVAVKILKNWNKLHK